MKTTGFSPASLAGRIGGIGLPGQTSASGITALQALPGNAAVAPELAQIRYASTWPRGWMAAAVPQRVREFNVQASKAQMTLAFLDTLLPLLDTLERAVRHQLQLPSPAGTGRAQQALLAAKAWWLQRHALTWGSLDEALVWSPVLPARKVFQLAGWNTQTLQAEPQDRELVSFCLMGTEQAHGAWLAQHGRSSTASRFALASALAPLGIQLDRLDDSALTLSVNERHWPVLQERWMVKGNGRRLPAGQWVAPNLVAVHACILLSNIGFDDENALQQWHHALPEFTVRVHAVRQQVEAFRAAAQGSVEHAQPDQLARMQAFAQAFCTAGQTPAYDWVLAVVPAVRAVSRLRVARLLRSRTR